MFLRQPACSDQPGLRRGERAEQPRVHVQRRLLRRRPDLRKVQDVRGQRLNSRRMLLYNFRMQFPKFFCLQRRDYDRCNHMHMQHGVLRGRSHVHAVPHVQRQPLQHIDAVPCREPNRHGHLRLQRWFLWRREHVHAVPGVRRAQLGKELWMPHGQYQGHGRVYLQRRLLRQWRRLLTLRLLVPRSHHGEELQQRQQLRRVRVRLQRRIVRRRRDLQRVQDLWSERDDDDAMHRPQQV